MRLALQPAELRRQPIASPPPSLYGKLCPSPQRHQLDAMPPPPQQTIILAMTQPLQMSLTQYFQIKDKLVPKHLVSNQHHRRREIIRKQMLAESPFEIIQKAKQRFLRPIGEIETIMDHFDSKFTNRRTKERRSSQRHRRRKRTATIMTEGSNHEKDLQARMKYLINLPSIGNVKREAEKYRCMLNADDLKEKEGWRARIMEEFGTYMEAEMRGNPKPSIKRRVKTTQ